MKTFFLTGSIIFTVLILILAFENMGITLSGFMFVFIPMDIPFLMILALSALGVVTGIFYTGLITTLLRSGKDEEEAPGNEW